MGIIASGKKVYGGIKFRLDSSGLAIIPLVGFLEFSVPFAIYEIRNTFNSDEKVNVALLKADKKSSNIFNKHLYVSKKSSSDSILTRLNEQHKVVSPLTIYSAAAIVLLLCFHNALTSLIIATSFLPAALLHLRSKYTCIVFNNDNIFDVKYKKIISGLEYFGKSKAKWKVVAGLAIGSGEMSQRIEPIEKHDIAITIVPPPGVITNIDIACLSAGEDKIYFMPDCIIHFNKGSYKRFTYSALSLLSSQIKMKSQSSLPTDSNVIEKEWLFSKKNGDKDLRHKYNQMVPVALFEKLNFRLRDSLDWVILSSLDKTAGILLALFQDYRKCFHVGAAGVSVKVEPNIQSAIIPEPIKLATTFTDIPNMSRLEPKERHPIDELPTFTLDETADRSLTIPRPTGAAFPKKQSEGSSGEWIPRGKPIMVGSLEIPGGMIYAGNVPRSNFTNPEFDFINSKLAIASKSVDMSVPLMSYWPSYQSITPEARRTYLQWLVDGRSDPKANIGYVFLFFYGLERRLLVDDVDESEKIEIISEIVRLQAIYENNSFQSYSSNLLNYLSAIETPKRFYGIWSPDLSTVKENHFKFSVSVGQMALDDVRLNSEWALAWVFYDDRIKKGVLVERCANEFKASFCLRYKQKHPEGLKLTVNKTKIKARYVPASPNLRGKSFVHDLGSIPDLMAIAGPTNKIQIVVDECKKELESFSKFLLKNPNSANSLEGLAARNFELWDEASRTKVNGLKHYLESEIKIISFKELLALFKTYEIPQRPKVIKFMEVLAAQNVYFEPEIIAGANMPAIDDDIAIFTATALQSDKPIQDETNFHAAITTLDLAVAVIVSDGHISSLETAFVNRYLESLDTLLPIQLQRLKARFALKLKNPDRLSGLTKKVDTFPMEAKKSIANILVQLVNSDDKVALEEIALLEKIYKSLGLDHKTLLADIQLNQLADNVNDITKVPDIIAPDQPIVPSFTLDHAKIAQLHVETQKVSALLAGVFADEMKATVTNQDDTALEADTQSVVEETGETEACLFGLDATHSGLLRFLLTRTQWSRSELDDLAVDFDLMIDGAIEQINEAFYDEFDEPLIEGDDPIEINTSLVDKLPA